MVSVVFQNVEAEPPPVDPVLLNQTGLDLHYLDKIHLLAVGRTMRIFPDNRPTVRKVAVSVESPDRRLASCEYLKELFQFPVSSANTFFSTEQMGNNGALKNRIRSVQSKQCIWLVL